MKKIWESNYKTFKINTGFVSDLSHGGKKNLPQRIL